MNKKLIHLSVGVLLVLTMVGCNSEDKLSKEQISDAEYQELTINDAYYETQGYLEVVDEYVEYKYKGKDADRSEVNRAKKSMRPLERELQEIDMDLLREYYKNEDNTVEYYKIINKYNQTNRTIKYINGFSRNILINDMVTDEELFNWICMREICTSEEPFTEEMKDNDEYDKIVEEDGYSIIDKQFEFDEKYEVKDI